MSHMSPCLKLPVTGSPIINRLQEPPREEE